MSAGHLIPTLAPEQFYPADAVFMARSGLKETRLLAFEDWNLDFVTNTFMGLMNGMTTIRHRAGACEEILGLFDRAGLPVAEDLNVYDFGEQAETLADDFVAAGRRLVFLYPLRKGRFPDDACLVAPGLWRRLNSKGRLAALAPAENLAPRRLRRLDEESAGNFIGPVYLKDASLEASGGGTTTRACLDAEQWQCSLTELGALGVEELVVEDALGIERCWCVTLALNDFETLFAGASEQTFEAPGVQSGNLIHPENAIPRAGVQLALRIADAARREGYRGVAGLDIGVATDGRFIVFDPNFRINSSSAQVLLHEAASRRAGRPVSSSVSASSRLPFSEIVSRLADPIDDGWFVPTRLLNAALLSSANGLSCCSGFVLAPDVACVASIKSKFAQLLSL